MTNRFLIRGVVVSRHWLLVALIIPVLGLAARAPAATPKAAQVTQIIKDVKLLPPQAPPRPASVSDTIASGTGLRTGADSRAELTFTDLTITRLGANTVFSFNEETRELKVEKGAILLQVPKDGAAAKLSTAGFTCAVTGGTALCETSKSAPSKVMILEGNGHFCATVGGCVDIPPGEMVVMTLDGHFTQPFKFNVALVMETSHLITDFPPLPNAYLIAQIIFQQAASTSAPGSTPPGGTINAASQRFATGTGTPPPAPGGTPSEFGPPQTITSPNPYVIGNGTSIQTDPTITTNGVTDYGKIFRDTSLDGPVPQFLYGSSRPFDSLVFDTGGPSDGPYAVFKFSGLQFTGDPSISTGIGGAVNLALVSVGAISSGSPGGTLTFAGMQRVFIGTQNGSINLGSEISFLGLSRLTFYARGAGSNLTLASPIDAMNLKLYSEGTIQVNGAVNVAQFKAISGGDFLTGTGQVTAGDIEIRSLANIYLDSQRFPNPGGGGNSIILDAANALNLLIHGGGTFGWDSLEGRGATINLTDPTLTTFDFSNSSSVTLTAGAGGINAPNIEFFGHNLTLDSAGDINIHSAITPLDMSSQPILDGSMTAAGMLSTAGDVFTGSLDVGSASIGGRLRARSITADSGVSASQGIAAVGGSIEVGGNLTSANGSIELQQDSSGTFGNITVGGNIFAGGGLFTPGNPVVVTANGSITAPGIITATLHAGTDITIDNTAGSFGFGLIANTTTAGGTLYMINSPSISTDGRSSINNDGSTADDLTLTVGAIVSTGPTYPIVYSNGEDAKPAFMDSNPGNGGRIAITTSLAGLSIGAAHDLDSIQAYGGSFNPGGPFGGGDGGHVELMAAGNVLVDSPNGGGPAILATTGIVSSIFSEYGGAGGTVNITAAGSITVNGSVQVSSDDAGLTARPTGNIPGRESASGGIIDLQSNLTTGEGINVSGALLSLLSSGAPGSGGSITLSTMGADITVTGQIEADRGTITIDQIDPVGPAPSITINGADVISHTLNITGVGDLNIAQTGYTTLYFSQGTWNVANDVNWNVGNSLDTPAGYTNLPASIDFLNVTAGHSIHLTGVNVDGVPASLTLNLATASTFHAQSGDLNATGVDIFYSGAELNLMASGDIIAHSIQFTDFFARGTVDAGGAIAVTTDLFQGVVTAGTSIGAGGNISVSTLTAGTTVTAGGYISANSITAGGAIMADSTHVLTIDSPTGVFTVTSGISPLVFTTDPMFPQGAAAAHVYTVDSIVSPNGIDFSGNQFHGIAGLSSGGLLTVNTTTLTFDPSSGVGPVNFNGADAGALDFDNMVFTTVGGSGGTFMVNATGDINVNAGSSIIATTGEIDPNLSPATTSSGTGGTVQLSSTNGEVAVSSAVQVSSAEPTSTIAPFRASARGGNISISSGKASGVAINVTNSGQLLALLSNAAPGPGGTITVQATGASSQANISGTVQADHGTIDIRHSGGSGQINVSGATMLADIIKIGALGTNGTLTIGGGMISADSLLRLYAPSSNGTLNFISNVTLSSGTAMDLAANTITIQPAVLVTIAGAGGAANIYTNNANYSGFSGTNPSNGTFGGNGANAPQPLSNAPPLGPAPQISSPRRVGRNQ